MDQDDAGRLLDVVKYASEKHAGQFRKGSARIPYVNHPIAVAQLLSETGTTDIDLLSAALLHDVVEDTGTSIEEIVSFFGIRVASIVKEVSDDMSLPHDKRKQFQVDNARNLSNEAKLIRIADKVSNLRDIMAYPIDWDTDAKMAYARWAEEVVAGCRGINPALDIVFEETMEKFNTFVLSD